MKSRGSDIRTQNKTTISGTPDEIQLSSISLCLMRYQVRIPMYIYWYYIFQ